MSINTLHDYLINIGRYPLCTATEEIELGLRIREGDAAAREELIRRNLKLVVNVAKNYKNAHLSLMDLISEGNLGLITAVEKYNPDLGYRFSTCAVPWIKQAIGKAITDKGRNIRIPAHIYQLLSKYRTAVNKLGADGHEPTSAELARELGVEEEKVKELENYRYDTVSLSTPLGDGVNDDTLEDLQADQDALTSGEYVDRSLLSDAILAALNEYPERTATIMKMRYGLDGFVEHTLEEIGEALDITRERVRQIEKQTLMELRFKLEKLGSQYL